MVVKIKQTEKLELVEIMSKEFENISLDGTILIACQHILKTNYQMFLSLFEKGLKPKNTFILGKCYSTDREVLELFIEIGVNISKKSSDFDSHEAFDEQYDRNVEEFFRESIKIARSKNPKKIVILDDGGHMISIANRILRGSKKIVGIEQTSSGYNKIKKLKLKFPVINVARSKAKLNHESPIIADLFVKNLEYELKELKKKVRKVLILGKGPIGISISKKLKFKEIKFYDSDFIKSDFSENELKESLGNFDLIIGCTGENSFKSEWYNLLKENTILVSASSSDREFSAKELRVLDERYFECHQNKIIRKINLLNSGFPLTFSKHKMGAEGNEIQLTRALIFSSIIFASKEINSKGIIDINKELQDKILLEFYKEKVERRLK
jgi:S-adenosylhomocysteine hydrolase